MHCVQAASHEFAALVSGIPELVEAYEGADAAGATVRRYAIINEDQQVPLAWLLRASGDALRLASAPARLHCIE